ncbi:MarR family winged helix-turn-helix transcriptional regulator [Lactiplantibacillus mudanjiangensis]|uniref:Transcriptional regulator [Lactobacillus brevis ATCC 367] n=1 Tax=Lactiplantibacillus mudanjiangensis TaxID=1296538 RepID=A0A660EBR4_9LACO|nr:MarR family transcriptional regulator [Lactiplantibacillus mudanjiangensis]VDG30405.1 Transcriptional regulator [Lactobacillus brevis ATCC 367] [Lactiplantibacillus mudanjiangensis]VDG30812.1 Transcriptional regulator [Lactobacillus brevis ATCC 367] [Lactiplantibacillus mudanjiangensis]
MVTIAPFNKYIASIYRQSKNEFNQQVAALDIRATEGDLLLFISDHPNISQRQIAQQMVLDPSLVARDLRDLVTRQLVTRTADPHDGRAHLIALTVLGQQQANEIRQVMANWWAALFAATPKADAQTTSDQLAAIYETLQNRLRGTDASR